VVGQHRCRRRKFTTRPKQLNPSIENDAFPLVVMSDFGAYIPTPEKLPLVEGVTEKLCSPPLILKSTPALTISVLPLP